MRADRPSLTASLVASVRALYTELPAPYNLAPDPFAEALVAPLFRLPAAIARRAPWAADALRAGVGAAFIGLPEHVELRTRAIDDALLETLRAGASQLVVLGAGLDSRADRLAELAPVRVFEIDHPSSHRYKLERLASVLGTRHDVARVAIDFERDRLEDKLLEAGFSTSAPAFWIWEGVTVYLVRDAIEATIRAVGSLSAKGSRLAMTYTPPDEPNRALLRSGRALLQIVGEPVRGLLPTSVVEELLGRAGMKLLSDESARDWSRRYWATGRDVHTWEHLALAERI